MAKYSVDVKERVEGIVYMSARRELNVYLLEKRGYYSWTLSRLLYVLNVDPPTWNMTESG